MSLQKSSSGLLAQLHDILMVLPETSTRCLSDKPGFMLLVLAAGGALSMGIWLALVGAISGAFGPTERLWLFRLAVIAGLLLILTSIFALTLLLSGSVLSSLWVTLLAIIVGLATGIVVVSASDWVAVNLRSPSWALTASVPVAAFILSVSAVSYAVLGRCSSRQRSLMVGLSLLSGALSVGGGELITLRHTSGLDLFKAPIYGLFAWTDALASWSIACAVKCKRTAVPVMIILNLVGMSILFIVQR